MEKADKTRLAAILLNVLIIALCAASVISCFCAPLLRVSVTYTLKADSLKKLLKNEQELLEQIDLEELVGEKGITLSLGIEFRPTDAYRAVSGKSATSTVDKMIENNVDRIVDELTPTLDEIAERIVRVAVHQSVNTVIRDRMKDILAPAEGTTDEETAARVNELLEQAEITDEYITEKVDGLLDVIYSENATTDDVSAQIVSTVNEVFEKLSSTDDPAFAGKDLTLDEEKQQLVQDKVDEVLQTLQLANENGELTTDELASRILLEMLRAANGEQNEENGTEDPDTVSYRFRSEKQSYALLSSDAEETEDVKAELKAEVKSMLTGKIPKNTANAVATVLKVIGYLLIFTCFTWLYPVLKILVKLFMKNPTVKFKLPVLLGWIPALLFGILPNSVLFMLKSGNALFVSLLGEKTLASVQTFLTASALSFTTALWMTFASAMTIIVLWFFYRPIRNKLKN